ncbi:hypothetical protein F511_27931 [Dorcoceras hygrometricum]|uniref:Uncharacterized protein n=1 Tax=Dorcoceras hygrometricum TaxID=472368 RepID=A0A2Z7CGF9_9LAMI|nr:hypothetical protein F511_27931 [Dorcoceras hygrometricum]
MRAKLVVFPIRGRSWCFSRMIDPSRPGAQSPNTPSTLRELYSVLFSSNQSPVNGFQSSQTSKVELVVDFVANKMNVAWINLEKAPQGTIKNKIHVYLRHPQVLLHVIFGLKLLSRVKPSEIFFKSIPKETDCVEITYPSRGSVIHKQYFYKSAILLPLTSVFMVLPLPNVPFFWILFRTYSHWRASQGSEKLLHLVTDSAEKVKVRESSTPVSNKETKNSVISSWVFQPSADLDKLLVHKDGDGEGLNDFTISKICQKFYLNAADVVKYRNSM